MKREREIKSMYLIWSVWVSLVPEMWKERRSQVIQRGGVGLWQVNKSEADSVSQSVSQLVHANWNIHRHKMQMQMKFWKYFVPIFFSWRTFVFLNIILSSTQLMSRPLKKQTITNVGFLLLYTLNTNGNRKITKKKKKKWHESFRVSWLRPLSFFVFILSDCPICLCRVSRWFLPLLLSLQRVWQPSLPPHRRHLIFRSRPPCLLASSERTVSSRQSDFKTGGFAVSD